MIISNESVADLNWWITNLPSSFAPVHRHSPDYTIETDASTLGWGAHSNGRITGGRWSLDEAAHHINWLELKACFLALQSFIADKSAISVHLKSDKATAVAYLHHFGGSKSILLNSLTREIWSWCMVRNIWLTVSHLSGTKNFVADYASRNFRVDLEWKLRADIFHELTQRFLEPDIDLFASRLNYQMLPYVSWQADPAAEHTDAFTLDWASYSCFFAFPPFCLIAKVLTKAEHDRATGILIVPLWHTQPWFPKMLKLLIRKPLILPLQQNLLSLPFSDRRHPLRDRLRLTACLLSGRRCDSKAFQDQLPRLSLHPVEPVQEKATNRHLGNDSLLFSERDSSDSNRCDNNTGLSGERIPVWQPIQQP